MKTGSSAKGFAAVWSAAKLLITAMMYLGCLAAILMMVHVVADVAYRTVFGGSLAGTTLIVTEYYMVACAFLPLAYTELTHRHISMDAISDMLPRRWQTVQAALGSLVTAVVFAVLTYSAWLAALKKTALGTFDIESGIRLYLWPAMWLLPLGCGALCLLALMRMAGQAAQALSASPEDT